MDLDAERKHLIIDLVMYGYDRTDKKWKHGSQVQMASIEDK